MTISDSLRFFQQNYLATIANPIGFPDQLNAAGFVEVDRRQTVHNDGSWIDRVLFCKPGAVNAFSCVMSNDGPPSDGALILANTVENNDALLAFIHTQPNLVETTVKVRPMLDLAPQDISRQLAQSQFWSSKEVEKVGINYTLGPSPFDLSEGGKSIALTASRNLSLQDPLTSDLIEELTGDGSKLHKLVLTFCEAVTKACPNLEEIVAIAAGYGFQGEVEQGATSFVLNGGYGPDAAYSEMLHSIHVNCDTDYMFELALSFSLDERLTKTMISDILFARLGMTNSMQEDGTARIELQGETYIVRHWVTSELFGNHAFLLQR